MLIDKTSSGNVYGKKYGLRCNKLLESTASQAANDSSYKYSIAMSIQNSTQIYITNVDIAKGDVASLKTWLKENEVYFYYPLNEPTFEPFSDENQQKLNALTTYYGTTVMYTTDNLQPTINVDYIADTKLYINKQIKNAVTELQSQLASTLSLMPVETQAEMIENDTNNLLQSI